MSYCRQIISKIWEFRGVFVGMGIGFGIITTGLMGRNEDVEIKNGDQRISASTFMGVSRVGYETDGSGTSHWYLKPVTFRVLKDDKPIKEWKSERCWTALYMLTGNDYFTGWRACDP